MLKRNFIAGKMNLDADERLLPPGEYREALNIQVSRSEDSDVGAVENSLGNTQLTNINIGANQKCVGGYADQTSNRIYLFLVSDTTSAIYEWDETAKTLASVLYDDRVGDANVLNFDPDFYITAVDVITDSDNGKRFLVWSDNNEPRFVNIETAKGWGNNNFDKFDIALAKRPPVNPPTITLATSDNKENYIEDKFLAFAYRYKYEDQMYSAMSPFSPWAFEPKTFNYDYSTSTNVSMVNLYNQVNITFNTGGSRVVGIDVLYKKSGSQSVFVMESYDKDDQGWQDDEEVSVQLLTSKSPRQLASDEIGRLFDAVPRQAVAMEVIDNRIVFGNYTENYNLLDSDGNEIDFDFSIARIDSPDSDSKRSMKSNRDYEVAMAYLDEYGRMTTALSSPNGSVFIPNEYCATANRLQATIAHNPPSWATHYRFFVKQTRTDYETITPIVFYAEGRFIWIRVQGDDTSKINEGDILYVKSDTNGILETVEQVEVLEIKVQSENFLEDTPPDPYEVLQEAGTYFKIKPDGFVINNNKTSYFKQESKGYKSKNIPNNVSGNVDYIEDPIYYGDTGLDDLTKSGTYTGTEDIRYIVEIVATGAPDTFRWSDDDGATWTGPTNCAAGPLALNNGVSISFANTTGHSANDYWIIPARSADVVTAINATKRAWVPFKCKTLATEYIRAGAQITIKYYESRDGIEIYDYNETFTSTQNYPNLEEWFYGDGIINQLVYPSSFDDVIFRRGTAVKDPPETIAIDATKDLWMLFVSKSEWYNYIVSFDVFIDASIEITELENSIVFETSPIEEPADIFYEIGKTYEISGGYHLGDGVNDTNQTATVPAQIVIDAANCFVGEFGIESYKIKDKLTGNSMKLDTRASASIQDYRENKRVASFTWSGKFEQSTNYNSLNEFNLSTANSIDLDDRYGSIQKLFSHKGKLIAFQEDRIQPIGYLKNMIFDNQGNSTLVTSDDLFNLLEPYAGDYGISVNPESFAVSGNRMYFTDQRRGKVLRLSADGITEISEYGMSDYFRDEFEANKTNFRPGAYDPYMDRYVLASIDRDTVTPPEFGCGSSLQNYKTTEAFTYTFKFSGQNTRLTIGYTVSEGTIGIVATWNGTPVSVAGATGSGTLVVERDDLSITDVTVTVTPTGTSSYSLSHTCEATGINTVKVIVLNDAADAASSRYMVNRYKINGASYVFSENNLFLPGGVTLFKTLKGFDGQGQIPGDGDSVTLEAFGPTSNHYFYPTLGNRIGYLVSSTDYGVSDVDTIAALATFPSVTQSDSGGDRTSFITFSVSKTSSDILYLILDYRNLTVDAVDDDVDLYWGEQADINVITNDIVLKPLTLTIESAPSHGTATVISSGAIRYVHDGGADASDSFVYRITNVYGTDTATVNITLTDPDSEPGGRPGLPGSDAIAFLMSSTGNALASSMCGVAAAATRYHDGASTYPTLDDYIYTDAAKTTPFDGSNLYYSMGNGYLIKVGGDGRVLDVYYCSGSGGGGSL